MISERNNSSVLSKAVIIGMIHVQHSNYFIMTDQRKTISDLDKLLQVICPGNSFTS